MARRLILIPPSEGKALGGEGRAWREVSSASPELERRRDQVLSALVEFVSDGSQRAVYERVFGVRGEALDRSLDANATAPTAPTLPAIERYEGVLYQHLDAPSLDRAAARRLDRDVVIVSGLWGLVRPDEPIPDYRLKMSTSLGSLGRLSTWWRPALSAEVAARSERAEVWNLLPHEHAAALDLPERKMVNSAVWLEPDRAGSLRPVSHWNKALKGALVGHLLRHPTLSVDDLEGWEHPAGYQLDPSSLEPEGRRRRLRFVKID